MDLFAFDHPDAWSHVRLVVEEVVPIAAIDEDDLLLLAARMPWPAGHPVPPAMRRAVAARKLDWPTSHHADEWNPVPGHGIEGQWSGGSVLIGHPDLLAEAGIDLTLSARTILDCHAREQWFSLLVGAANQSEEPHEGRRSLLGVIALRPATEDDEPFDDAPGEQDVPDVRRTPSSDDPVKTTVTVASPVRRERALPVGRVGRTWWVPVLLVCAAVAGVLSSLIRILPGEAGVVLRLGRPVAVWEPGLHILARPLDRLIPIELDAEHVVDVASDGQGGERPLLYSASSVIYSFSYRARVRYHISDPIRYALVARRPERHVEMLFETALCTEIAALPLEEILNPNRTFIIDAVRRRLNESLSALNLGVTVDAVILDALSPYGGDEQAEVESTFATLRQLSRETAELRRLADVQAERTIQQARAAASQRIVDAHHAHGAAMQDARARIDRFRALSLPPDASPADLRRRLLDELVLDQVLQGKAIVIDDASPTSSASQPAAAEGAP